MNLKLSWIISGLFLVPVLVLLTAACGEDPDTPKPRSGPAAAGSFTFFNIGSQTPLDAGQRKSLEKILGDAAVERRGIVNLEMNPKTFLKDHFPELDRMNRQLNSEIGLRVKHRVVRLMYRYAKQRGLPYDLVEIIYSEKTTRPILIRLQYKTGDTDAFKALEEKYGPPRKIDGGPEQASTHVWQKEGDYLFHSIVPKRGGKVEYRIAIYFTTAIEALIQSEKAGTGAEKQGKTGF
jgi:hypothetical protein